MIPTDMGAGGLPHGTLTVKSSGELPTGCTMGHERLGAVALTPLFTSTYNQKKSRKSIDPTPTLADNTTMQTKIVCAVCGEETGGKPTYSLYGSVHKWGPTDHKFEPKEIAIEEEKQ